MENDDPFTTVEWFSEKLAVYRGTQDPEILKNLHKTDYIFDTFDKVNYMRILECL